MPRDSYIIGVIYVSSRKLSLDVHVTPMGWQPQELAAAPSPVRSSSCMSSLHHKEHLASTDDPHPGNVVQMLSWDQGWSPFTFNSIYPESGFSGPLWANQKQLSYLMLVQSIHPSIHYHSPLSLPHFLSPNRGHMGSPQGSQNISGILKASWFCVVVFCYSETQIGCQELLKDSMSQPSSCDIIAVYSRDYTTVRNS